MNKLEELKAKLKKKNEASNSSGDRASYPFWKLAENAKSTIRFLPDKDDNNPCFWVEKMQITLPFPGTTEDPHKPVKVTIPCMQMYGERCPIQEAIKDFWNDPETKSIARTYYRKIAYIFHGFVVSSGFSEEEKPENPIRKFMINKGIYDQINAELISDEMDVLPWDYDNGYDFNIIKTRQGEYASYSTSGFGRRSRSLSQAERDAIDKYGIPSLKSYLPEKPKNPELFLSMFNDSLDGLTYDLKKYSEYRPYSDRNSLQSSNTDDTESEYTPVSAKSQPVVLSSDPVRPAASAPSQEEKKTNSATAQELLAKLKNKKVAG